jgi:protein associated with RNAse G/E
MEPVVVQYYKNPDLLHWGFAGHLIGEDEHGLWVGLPQGSDRWKGDVRQGQSGEDAVLCFPHRGWWTLHYSGPGHPVTHFVDITTQPVRNGDRIEMIDLDLDVLVTADGEIVIEDEDEFELHLVRYRYSQEMIEGAKTETENVARRLRRRQEPFFEVAAHWLGVLRSTT